VDHDVDAAVTHVVVLADTHIRRGTARRLSDAVYAHLDRADLILHAGDVVVDDVLAELGGFATVHAVLGNNDIELVGLLPETRVFDVDGVRIGMIHDSGPSTGRAGRMRRRFPDADVVVFGHSHIPADTEGLDGQVLFNPGSPTERRAQPHRTLGTLDLDGGRVVGRRIHQALLGGLQPELAQAGLEALEGGLDLVEVRLLGVQAHDAPVELLTHGVDLDGMGEDVEGAPHVAGDQAGGAERDEDVDGAPAQVFAGHVGPGPVDAGQELTVVHVGGPLEGGGPFRITGAGPRRGQGGLEAPEVDIEDRLDAVAVAVALDDLEGLGAGDAAESAPQVAQSGPEPLRTATRIGLGPQRFGGHVERGAFGVQEVEGQQLPGLGP